MSAIGSTPSHRFGKRALRIVLIAVSMVFLALPVAGQTEEPKLVYKSRSDQVIYNAASESRDSIGFIPAGDALIVFSRGANRYWKVEYDGLIGYTLKNGLVRVKGVGPDDLRGWEAAEKATGDETDCPTPRYSRDLDNSLWIEFRPFTVPVSADQRISLHLPL